MMLLTILYILPLVSVITWYLLAYKHPRGIYRKDLSDFHEGWEWEMIIFSIIPVINLATIGSLAKEAPLK